MIITIPYYFSTGSTIIASQHNSNFSVIYNAFNGSIDDSNISSTAGIEYTKLDLTNNIRYADLTAATIASLTSAILPSGVILMWSGSIATIPTGWVICDGTHSTPNLTNRFVIAADATNYPVGATGDGTIPAHKHYTYGENPTTGASWPYGTDGTTNQIGSGNSDTDNTHFGTTSFGTGTTVIAIYYALCYIMKS